MLFIYKAINIDEFIKQNIKVLRDKIGTENDRYYFWDFFNEHSLLTKRYFNNLTLGKIININDFGELIANSESKLDFMVNILIEIVTQKYFEYEEDMLYNELDLYFEEDINFIRTLEVFLNIGLEELEGINDEIKEKLEDNKQYIRYTLDDDCYLKVYSTDKIYLDTL